MAQITDAAPTWSAPIALNCVGVGTDDVTNHAYLSTKWGIS